MPTHRIHNVAGVNIRRHRSLLGISQAALARRCQHVGWNLSRVTIAKIESGIRHLNDAELVLLAQVLSISPRELIAASEEQLLDIARHSAPIE